ncbi:methyltransferase domain-containing protein [Nocardia sp. NPDC048505]|uniref:class I SAM-dependent methyltransferase n=1 Tax=Nocardia sp. NPDC048505 TaxID=3155756 RepID=UPI0033C336CA
MTASTRPLNRFVHRGWGRVARVYDFPPVQRLMYRPPQDEIIARLAVHGGRRVADVGCGTGILASRIRADLPVETVYGFDAAAGMLRRARARTDRVLWRQRPAEDLGLAEGELDAVVSTHAFPFFNHGPAVAEFHRVLRPRGLLALVVFNPEGPLTGVLQPALMREAMYWPSPGEMRTMLADSGFEVVEQRRVRRPLFGTSLVRDVVTVAERR